MPVVERDEVATVVLVADDMTCVVLVDDEPDKVGLMLGILDGVV